MNIYDRIDSLLKERNMSRRELARRAGINVNTFASLFARKPEQFPERFIPRIAEVLNVEPSALTGLRLLTFPDVSAEVHAVHADAAPVPPDMQRGEEDRQTDLLLKAFDIFLNMDDTSLEVARRFIDKVLSRSK